MKVVLDTNVLISAIVFGGKSRQILEMGIAGKINIAISYDIIKELSEVLVGKKFQMPASLVQQIIQELTEITELIIVTKKVNIIKNDPDDNLILSCAESARVDYIISGDNDLLCFKQFKKIKILSPAAFLKEY